MKKIKILGFSALLSQCYTVYRKDRRKLSITGHTCNPVPGKGSRRVRSLMQ